MPGAGAFGPYSHNRQHRIVYRSGDGKTSTKGFASERAAIEFRDAINAEVATERQGERTVGQAIDSYEAHLRIKGNRPTSLSETPRRLKQFFSDMLEEPIADVSRPWCARRYDRLSKEISPATGRPYSVSTHRNILLEARSFLRWSVKHHFVHDNALDGIEGSGKRKKGKAQLRVDEARAWYAEARKEMRRGEAGAIAAACAMLLGMRASEIVSRTVRDLDDNGRLLWIPDAKTEAGRRTLEVPDILRPALRKLAKGRKSDELLFGHHWRDWVGAWVAKLCEAAGVPVVTAHGMRGFAATMGMAHGIGPLIAAALGHESEATTMGSYADRGTVEEKQRKGALQVLKGGRR